MKTAIFIINVQSFIEYVSCVNELNIYILYQKSSFIDYYVFQFSLLFFCTSSNNVFKTIDNLLNSIQLLNNQKNTQSIIKI